MSMILWSTKPGQLTEAEADELFRLWVGAPLTIEIANGIITINGAGWYSVNTEASAATDDLTRINGCIAGEVVQLRAANAAREVIVQPSSFLKLNQGEPHYLTGIYSSILLRSYGSDVLVEIARTTIPA